MAMFYIFCSKILPNFILFYIIFVQMLKNMYILLVNPLGLVLEMAIDSFCHLYYEKYEHRYSYCWWISWSRCWWWCWTICWCWSWWWCWWILYNVLFYKKWNHKYIKYILLVPGLDLVLDCLSVLVLVMAKYIKYVCTFCLI